MTQRKRTHEDCPGEAFATKVIAGYPRKKTDSTKINRSVHVMIEGKTMATNQENG